MLVGADRADLPAAMPVIAGAVPDHVWNHCSHADLAEIWQVVRREYDPDDIAYEWREVWVELDSDALRQHFVTDPPGNGVHPPTVSDGQVAALAYVGVYVADWEDPQFRQNITLHVVGVIPEFLWSTEDEEDTKARWERRRVLFDPTDDSYEWREVWVTLDSAWLLSQFEARSCEGSVLSPQTDAPVQS